MLPLLPRRTVRSGANPHHIGELREKNERAWDGETGEHRIQSFSTLLT
jgi:hypothetical protein